MEHLTLLQLVILLSCLLGCIILVLQPLIYKVWNLDRQMKSLSQSHLEVRQFLQGLQQQVEPVVQLALAQLAPQPLTPQPERQVSPLVHQFLQQEPQPAVPQLQLAEQALLRQAQLNQQRSPIQSHPPLQVAPQEQTHQQEPSLSHQVKVLQQALQEHRPGLERLHKPIVQQELAPTHQQTVQALQLAERAPQLRREQTLQAIQEHQCQQEPALKHQP